MPGHSSKRGSAMSFGNEVVPGENAISPSVFPANDCAATWRCAVSTPGNLAPTYSSFIFGIVELPPGEMPIHLIELIDIEIGQTFATYRLDRFSVFLPRLLRSLYNLSAFRTTALTCLKSPTRKLHSFARPTYHNLSVHVMEPRRGEVSIYHYRERSYLFRTFNLLSSFASFIDVARKRSCQCLSIDLAPF